MSPQKFSNKYFIRNLRYPNIWVISVRKSTNWQTDRQTRNSKNYWNLCTNITGLSIYFKKISHLTPHILNMFSQLTTDIQKKHTDRRANVNLKLAPPEVGQLKQNKNFNSLHTWFKMSATYVFSFFSNPSPHWHPVKTYKPNLFFPTIFWISLIFG